MSEQTFYGEWIDVSDGSMPELPNGSIWDVVILEEEEEGESCSSNEWETVVRAVSWNGVLCFNGETDQDRFVTRIRRVYPPGSVLPEPRLASTVDPKAFNRWPMWCWRNYSETMWTTTALRKSECSCFMCKNVPDYECYPVQQLDNGAFVAVPWLAVEGGK